MLVEQPPHLCGPLIESDVGQGVGAPFEQSEDFVRTGLLGEDPRGHRRVQRLTALRSRTGGGLRRHQPGRGQPHREHCHQHRRHHQTGVQPAMTAPSQRRLREQQQNQHEHGRRYHDTRRTGGASRRDDGVGLGSIQPFGGRQDVMLHQRGRFAEVGDSDRPSGAVVRTSSGHHPGVQRQLVGQVGEQRQ